LFVLASLLIITPACAAYDVSAGSENFGVSETGGLGETGFGTDTDNATAGSTMSSSTGDGDGDPSPGDGDGVPGDASCFALDCGDGECLEFDGLAYCDCPEGSNWTGQACDPCPLVIGANHVLDLNVITFAGRFAVDGEAPPANEYDDANVYLENRHTRDRVWLGNTHSETFSVRVTPGVYDVIYEVETPGPVMPANGRVRLERRPLFATSEIEAIIDIHVARVNGAFKLDGVAPPDHEYDDANVSFRLLDTTDEIVVGNTHDGSYAVNVVPGTYEVVYRNETPGPLAPRNVGATLGTRSFTDDTNHDIEIASVAIQGEFRLDGVLAPDNDYNDANVDLWSSELGVVALGNTHAGSYSLRVIPGNYEYVYRHETGPDVPQNQHARFGAADATVNGTVDVDIEMVTITGMLTINDVMAPPDELDDGIVHLRSSGGDDSVLLGNTHDGVYTVNLIPGSYAVYYAQETSGGTVPDNKNARIVDAMAIANSGMIDIDVPAVLVQGTFTIGGDAPPNLNYEDGRVYLRNIETDDTVLLGSTHAAYYTAMVVPGDYDVYYVQEAGGLVPANQNALIDSITVANAMSLDIDIPGTSLAGVLHVGGGEPPATASDGGQLYLRNATGDSVLLGDSFVPGFAANLVSGTYGVYYRAEGSGAIMPENDNGRFACVTVE
jgi:hypothetical protein